MAKSGIQCADCGEPMTVWGSNRSDADRRARWHEKNSAVCTECEIKQRTAESQSNAEANRTAGLPTLVGSEKQVAWAKTLRFKLLLRLEYTRISLTYRERAMGVDGEARDQLIRERRADRPYAA